MNTNKIFSKIFTALKISAATAIIILGFVYITRNPEPIEASTAATHATQTTNNGWVRYANGTHRYYKNNKMYTGWHWMTSKEGEKTPHWSYFGKDGIIRTGWTWLTAADGEKTPHWSYFGPNGWLRTGWQRMGTPTNPDGKAVQHWSYFGPNGWLRTGWVQLGKGTSNPDGNAPKHWSYFGPNGWLREGLQEMSTNANPDGNQPKHKSYFGNNGWLVENKTFTVNSVTYKADAKGWCTQISSTPVKQNNTATKTTTVSTVKKTDIVNRNGKWVYTVNGTPNYNYTGFAKNINGWWYVENGVVTFKKNDIIHGNVNGVNAWWHIKGSKVVFDTTVSNNIHGWWYVKNGKVDFSYTGIARNEHGTWYLENGKVTFKKNDIVLANINGVTAWYHIKDSRVTQSNTVANNVHGWWYVKNGKVDFSYTGFAQNEHGWWYIENGKVTFKKDSVIYGKVNGVNAWWNVKGSNVKFNNSVENNEHGWWYIKNGKVDFSYTGFARNTHGWWYIENGKVTFHKNGNIKGVVDGKTSTWVVKDSKVTGEYKAPATNTNKNNTTTNTNNNTSNTSTGKIKIGGKTNGTTTNTTNNNTNKTNTTTNTTNTNTNKTNTNTNTNTNNNTNKTNTTNNNNNKTNTTTNTNKPTTTHTHSYTTPVYKTVHHNEIIDDSEYETNVVTYAGQALYMFSHGAYGMGQKDTIIQHYNSCDEANEAYTYVTGETNHRGLSLFAGLIPEITIDPATGKSVKDANGKDKYPKLWVAPSFNYKFYLNDCPNGANMWADFGTCIVAYKPQKVIYRKITPAYDEKILTGHKCSCGAVKDTTHVSQTKAPAVQNKTIIKNYDILWYHQYPDDFKTFVDANPEFKKHASLTTTSQADEEPGPESTNIYNYYKTYPYMKDYNGYGPDSYLKSHSGEAALNANKTIH